MTLATRQLWDISKGWADISLTKKQLSYLNKIKTFFSKHTSISAY